MNVTSSPPYSGLFAGLSSSGVIRDLGMINVNVTPSSGLGWRLGILVGRNQGLISASYVQGDSITAVGTGGGLVGINERGDILASYSTAAVNISTGTVGVIGGLVGGIYRGEIIASYAAGPVTGTPGRRLRRRRDLGRVL